jgi:pullulanase/glycogen debranching enzyme
MRRPTDSKGNLLAAPPLIRDIAKHPMLSKKHLIAEPWDLGTYQVGRGSFYIAARKGLWTATAGNGASPSKQPVPSGGSVQEPSCMS